MSTITWNNDRVGVGLSLSDGNLVVTSSVSSWRSVIADVGKLKGKWYWEIYLEVFSGGTQSASRKTITGISNNLFDNSTFSGNNINSIGFHNSANRIYYASSYETYGNIKATQGDTIGVSLDMDNKTLEYFINGNSQGVIYDKVVKLGSPVFPTDSLNNSGTKTVTNFGEKPFKYNPPTGFLPYNYKPIIKLILKNSIGYYSYFNGNWIYLGETITKDDIIHYGMSELEHIEIFQFENLYGNNWATLVWCDKEDVELNAILNATPKPQILTAKSSAEFSGVESAEFKWIATGNARVAISINDGLSYHAYRNGTFIDISDDISQGMTPSEYGSWTQEEFDHFKGDSNFIRHKYYLPDGAEIDDILIKANMKGHNELAKGHVINYDQSTKTITIDINKSGTYYTTYIDV